MATAQFSGQYGRNMTLEVWSDWNRQDIASNSSTVNVQARLRTNGYASVWGVTAPMTINVDGGNEIVNAGVNIGTNSSLLIFGKDYVVNHDGNGNKTVNISFKVDINSGGYDSATVNLSIPLPTIQRASTIGDVTGTLGSAMMININRKNNDFKHTVKYNFGALNGTIATGVGTSVSWTPPLNLATAMPNKTSDWGNITVDTYNGSTKIGSATCRLTLNVPESMKPALASVTLTDSNTAVKNLLNTANTFVQVLSNIKVTFNNASGAYGSTISSYRAEILGKNQNTNSNNGLLGMMNFNGSVTIRATVTDSRGRTSNPIDVQATVLNYFTPQLSFSASRSGSSSTTVTVTRNAKIAPLTVGGNQKNTMKLTFKYKEHSATSFTTDTGSAGGTWTTISNLTNSSANLEATFSVLKSYDIIGTVEDSFTSYEFLVTVGTESFPLALKVDRMGLGKLPEQVGIIDSAWQYYYGNKPIQHYKLTSINGGKLTGTDLIDINSVWDVGYYYVNGSAAGLPVARWGQLFVVCPDGNDTVRQPMQIFIADDGSGIYTRVHKRASTVGDWKSWTKYPAANSVAEFTAVNQTKVYTGIINGPYGFNVAVTRSGNVVTATMNYVHTSNTNWNDTANETIPIGWRPVSQAIIHAIGQGGSGTGAQLYNGSYVHLVYKPDGSISGRIKLDTNPLWFGATISWITTDPFPAE